MADRDVKLNEDSEEQMLIRQYQAFHNVIFRTLHEVSVLISKDPGPDLLLSSLPDILARPNGFKMAWVILLGPDKSVESGFFAALAGYPDVYESFIREQKIPPCLIPVYGKTGSQVINPFPAFNPEQPSEVLAGYAYPLRIKRQMIGFLVVAFDACYAWIGQHQELFEEIGMEVMTALYHDRTLLRLKESEEKFRVLFERSADAQLIMKGDVYLECNEAMCRIMGVESKNELTGLTPWEVSPLYQPDGIESRTKGLKLIKTAEDGQSVRFDWMHLRFDGTEALVEVSLTPVNYGSESFIHVAMRDISARLKAEKDLYVKNQHFQLIMANSADMIWIRDLNLKLTYINQAVERIKGYTPEEILPMDFKELVTPSTYHLLLNTLKEEVNQDREKGVDPGRYRRFEIDEICKDGSIIHTEALASFIRDEKGVPTGILGITRDISQQQHIFLELAKAKEKAEESDRLKSAFLANMSHEIRTPMNSILGFAELLGEDELDSFEKKQYIEIIQSGTNQLLAIISDIIDISKIQAGQVVLHPEMVNLDKLFEEMLVNFRMELARHNKSNIVLVRNCICHLSAENTELDVSRMNQIMGNLISNAIKFTETGTIEFGCKKQDGAMRFYVKDTGKGIDPAYQGIIFDRFRQVEESLTRAYTGTGLGLAICKGLVNLMGGNIGVSSVPGEGSEFWFTLPSDESQNN